MLDIFSQNRIYFAYAFRTNSNPSENSSKMYSLLSRNIARSGIKRVATTGVTGASRTRSASSRVVPRSSGINKKNSDVIAVPLPAEVTEAMQQAAAARKSVVSASILALGAAGLALVMALPVAMCEGDSVSVEEMEHDWDDFMYKSIKPGEDDDDDDEDDEEGDDAEEEEEPAEKEEDADEAGEEEEEATPAPVCAEDGNEMGGEYKKKWKKAMFKV